MRQIIKTIFSSGFAAVLNFFISLLIVPLITEKLGTEAYGFVSLANNFISYASILTLALNSYATRFISIEYHKGNIEKTREYYSSVVWANIALSALMLLIGIIVSVKLEYCLKIPMYLVADVKILFALVFANFIILNIGNSFAPSAYVHDKLGLAGVYKSIAYGMEIAVFVLLFAVVTPKLWYVGIAYIVYTIVISVSNYYIFYRYSTGIHISVDKFSITAIKKLVVSGVWNSINSLGNTLNSGLDLLITNMMLDAVTMGELAIAKTMGTISTSIYQLIAHAFQPLLLKTYAKNENHSLLEKLFLSMKVSGLFVGSFFVIFAIQGKFFLKLWVPTQNIEKVHILAVITLLSSVLEGVMGPLYYIYTLTVKNKIPCIVTVSGGILNVVAMYILLKETSLGVYAVVGTTAIIMIFINLVTNPIYMAKCLNMKWTTFYPVIMKYIFFIVVSGLCCLCTTKWFIAKNNVQLFLTLVIELLVCVGVYIVIMFDKKERDFIVKKIRKLTCHI